MKNPVKLDRLEEVNIREIWSHEQYDFSSWLAKTTNIELLNEILGLTLVDVKKEVYVGQYKCDLVAKDETSEDVVVVENQLESSDHDHLGKVITYASGLNANIVVWIVKEAREEHKSAIEWLNNNINKDISFFLLEIHAFKIGDSRPAPKFVVIEKPNDFVNSSKIDKRKILSWTESERLNFWIEFNRKLAEKNRPFNIRKPSTNHWYDVAIGSNSANIRITLRNKEKDVEVELNIDNDKELFNKLYNQRKEVEQTLNFERELKWLKLDERKASRIVYYIKRLDFNNKSNYDELMEEIINKVIKMREVFIEFM